MTKFTNPLFIPVPNIIELNQKASRNKKAGPLGRVIILGEANKATYEGLLRKYAIKWHLAQLKTQHKEWTHFTAKEGPIWILHRQKHKGPYSHHGRLEESDYTWFRESMGTVLSSAKTLQLKKLQLEFYQTSQEQELGALVGLGLAAYSYKNVIEQKGLADLPDLNLLKYIGKAKKPTALDKNILHQAIARTRALNSARHVVNTPPNYVNPTTVRQYVVAEFAKAKGVKVEVWDQQRLRKEGMGLHLGVGLGSVHPPCLVRIKYRPTGHKGQPIAFVGKGITFDTGGLDIKPSSAMRLMKKDMAGAAAVLGLAKWAVQSQFPRALDFYLALAENSVDGASMRPSDVLTARNGMKVEIHNTDAEGRLVLADALDVAVTQKSTDEPAMVVDVATLTGACRVALGAEIGGLFSNSDELAEQVNQAGQRAGDLNWRLPLYSRYTSSFSSPFADMVNAVDGFGGAITAALFLEKFVRNKPWVHLDVYSWNDKNTGAMTFSGGNAQTLQCLMEWLSSLD